MVNIKEELEVINLLLGMVNSEEEYNSLLKEKEEILKLKENAKCQTEK